MRLLACTAAVLALAMPCAAPAQTWELIELPAGPGTDHPKLLDMAIEGGTVWFATEQDGVLGYDGETWVLHTAADGGLRSNYYRYVIFVDSDGDKWTSKDNSAAAVDRLDDAGTFLTKSDDAWTYYNSPDQITSDRVFSMAEDRSGNKWFGIRDESSDNREPTTLELLVENDPDTTTDDEWLTFDYFDDEALFFDDDVRGLEIDTENRLWIVYSPDPPGNGVDVWDFGDYYSFDDDSVSHFGELEGLPSSSVYDVHAAPDGRVWVGTGAGLAYLDGSTREWTAVPGVTVRTRCVASDAQGHIWAGTDEGVVMLYASGEIAKLYDTSSGLHDDEVHEIAVSQIDGTVWAVTEDGTTGKTYLNRLRSGFGPESTLFVYPNPWRESESTEPLRVLGAPDGSTVEIIDLTGEVVRTLDAEREPFLWDTLDSGLNEVPSGVYIVKVETPSGEQVFTKVAILR